MTIKTIALGRSLWFINLDDVKEKVAQILNSLEQDIIISLAGWYCFSNALSLYLLLKMV
ncbi:MAG: hypothetical protein HC764_25775 [Pleurocapsa sp. CRU_1_2]|nr:hypothetical protein [Pleurocapsa sp. CRU_1_2]